MLIQQDILYKVCFRPIKQLSPATAKATTTATTPGSTTKTATTTTGTTKRRVVSWLR